MARWSWRFMFNERLHFFKRSYLPAEIRDDDRYNASARSYDIAQRIVEVSGNSDVENLMQDVATWLGDHKDFKLYRLEIFRESGGIFSAMLYAYPYPWDEATLTVDGVVDEEEEDGSADES